ESVQSPLGRDGGSEPFEIDVGGDVVEGIAAAGLGPWVAQRNHRTAPEVEDPLAVLVLDLDLQCHQAGGWLAGTGTILPQSDHPRPGAQRVPEVHRSQQDEPTV